MRLQQSIVLVLITVFLTLLAVGRSGCNPLVDSGGNMPATRIGRDRQTRAPHSADADSIRFDNTLVTHYSPGEDLERIDTDLLATATRQVDVAAYSLTDFALRDALISAAGRGVAIRIYADKTQSAEEEKRDSSVLRALAATPRIRVQIKHSGVLMHLKSYMIDGSLLRSGSANFSPTGEKRQDNDLSTTRNAVAIHAFESHFEEMWSRPDNDTLR